MAYTRKGTSGEVLSGSDVDILVTPATLKENVWYFDGNAVASEKDLGTTANFDIPIIRNNVEKIRIDNTTWTTNSHVSNIKIGTNGNAGVVRFPLNSSVQHGIVSSTSGSLSFIIANGESGASSTTATPIVITSNGNFGIGNSPSTNFDVTGSLRFRTFSTANNLLSVSDVNGNITSITPASALSLAGGFVQGGNSFTALGVLGTNDSFGLSIETVNTEAIRIDTSQNVGIGTSTPQTKFHLSGGAFRQQQTNVLSEQNVHANIDVDSAATEVVGTITAATFAACFFDYVVYDGTKTNMRAGTVTAVWNGSTVEYHETSTIDIGDTGGVTLSAALNGANVEFRATVTTDNWTVKCISRSLS